MSESINKNYLKLFQTIRWLLAPFLGPHGAVVQYLARSYAKNCEKVLDLGARRSPYTHGLRGVVVGLDLPAANEAKLGFNPQSLTRYDQAGVFPSSERASSYRFRTTPSARSCSLRSLSILRQTVRQSRKFGGFCGPGEYWF